MTRHTDTHRHTHVYDTGSGGLYRAEAAAMLAAVQEQQQQGGAGGYYHPIRGNSGSQMRLSDPGIHTLLGEGALSDDEDNLHCHMSRISDSGKPLGSLLSYACSAQAQQQQQQQQAAQMGFVGQEQQQQQKQQQQQVPASAAAHSLYTHPAAASSSSPPNSSLASSGSARSR